jgi:hypothetical protein
VSGDLREKRSVGRERIEGSFLCRFRLWMDRTCPVWRQLSDLGKSYFLRRTVLPAIRSAAMSNLNSEPHKRRRFKERLLRKCRASVVRWRDVDLNHIVKEYEIAEGPVEALCIPFSVESGAPSSPVLAVPGFMLGPAVRQGDLIIKSKGSFIVSPPSSEIDRKFLNGLYSNDEFRNRHIGMHVVVYNRTVLGVDADLVAATNMALQALRDLGVHNVSSERLVAKRFGQLRLWRTIIEVTNVSQDLNLFSAIVVGFDPDRTIVLNSTILPAEIKGALTVGRYLHAKVNIGAKSDEELIFREWEPR